MRIHCLPNAKAKHTLSEDMMAPPGAYVVFLELFTVHNEIHNGSCAKASKGVGWTGR